MATACQLSVGEGEKPPVIKPDEPIEGPVTRPFAFEVPYTSKHCININEVGSSIYWFFK